MVEFCAGIAEDPAGLNAEAEQRLHVALERAEELQRNGGLDGFIVRSDYCLNSGPGRPRRARTRKKTVLCLPLLKLLSQASMLTVQAAENHLKRERTLAGGPRRPFAPSLPLPLHALGIATGRHAVISLRT